MEAQTTDTPQQPQQQLELSPEDMLAKAAGLSEPDRPRNEQGRFVAKEAPAQTPADANAEPAAETKPAEKPAEEDRIGTR
jgi:hypothetical protein